MHPSQHNVCAREAQKEKFWGIRNVMAWNEGKINKIKKWRKTLPSLTQLNWGMNRGNRFEVIDLFRFDAMQKRFNKLFNKMRQRVLNLKVFSSFKSFKIHCSNEIRQFFYLNSFLFERMYSSNQRMFKPTFTYSLVSWSPLFWFV